MSPPREIQIAPIEDADMAEVFHLMSQSFGHNAPFIDAYFPAHDTDHGQVQGARRLTDWKQGSPESSFLKAVCNQAGGVKIMAMGIWTYLADAPPQTLEEMEGEDEVVEFWPDDQDREWMQALWKEYVKPRTKAVMNSDGKGLYVLELLAVHPDFRRQGAGAALVNWGVNAADNKGVGAIVESTDAGRKLYEACGMKCEIESITFDVGKKFKGKDVPKLGFMVKGATARP